MKMSTFARLIDIQHNTTTVTQTLMQTEARLSRSGVESNRLFIQTIESFTLFFSFSIFGNPKRYNFCLILFLSRSFRRLFVVIVVVAVPIGCAYIIAFQFSFQFVYSFVFLRHCACSARLCMCAALHCRQFNEPKWNEQNGIAFE